MFFALYPYFDLEPSPSMYFVYFSGVQCFSLFSSVRLFGICYRSDILVLCCAIVSYSFVSYFGQYWFSFSFNFG